MLPSMASPVPLIATEQFSSLPAQFRRTDEHSVWAEFNRGGAAIDSFLEGLSFDREGNLYLVDIPFGRVFRISPAGDWALVAEYAGWPNGLRIASDGRIFIADYRQGLMHLDPASGEVSVVLPHRNTEGFKGLNDLVIASNGDILFTDQGQTGLHDPTGRVYRLRADGRLDLLLSNVPSPNGIVLDAEEKVLYVAATRGNCIWRGPLMPDGTLSKVGNFFQLYGPTGPDGLAMDSAGNLAIAHPGSGSVWLVDPQGEAIARVKGPAGSFITNLAYGYDADGRANEWLYMTESNNGAILRAKMPVRGRTLVSHRPAGA
jgi:gluconolactonase